MAKGIVVTQQGIDISQALDSQEVLDSRFRYFDILKEVTVILPTIKNDGSTQVIYEHDAGFLPAFDVYDTVLGAYVSAANTLGAGLVSSTTQIYFTGFFNDLGWSNHKVLIRVYNVPITDNFQAPIEKTLPAKASAPSKYGVEVARGTTDMADGELSKFALNTKSKALAIQKSGTTQANSGTNFHAIIEHDLGHPPMFLFTYADPAGQWVSTIDPSLIPAFATADGVNINFRGAQNILNGTFAFIIFKELGDFAL